MPKTQTDPIETIHSMVHMLTQEGRITFEIVDPESPRLVIAVNTINREYGRILGSGCQTLRDLNTIAKAMIPECEIILHPRGDDTIAKDKEIQVRRQIDGLLHEVIDAIDEFNGSEIQPTSEGSLISTDCQDQELRVAIERLFFSIGRAQKHRFAITWR